MSKINFNTSDYPPINRADFDNPEKWDTNPYPEVDFMNQLDSFGLEVNGTIETDVIVRVSHRSKPSKKTGWYLYFGIDPHTGIAGGVYGDWRLSDESHYWNSKEKIQVSDDVWAQYQKRAAQAKAKAEQEKKLKQDETAKFCQSRVQELPSVVNHLYLENKRIIGKGLYCDSSGALLVPMIDSAGELRNLQKIYPNGEKYFTTGGQVLGCYHLIGPEPSNTVYLAEGYATGATIHGVTNQTVVVAFNTANLLPVAKAIRENYPDVQIVFCADNDRLTKDNPGVTKATAAAKAVGNAIVKIPTFKIDTGTDFNDLFKQTGIAEIKKQLGCCDLIDHIHDASYIDYDAIPARDWVYSRLLLSGYITACIAPGGTGKSVLSLAIAVSVAIGKPIMGSGNTVEQQRNVLMLNNEDDLKELSRRLSGILNYYDIDPSALKERLYIRSGYSVPALLASVGPDDKVKQTFHTTSLIKFIKEKNIGLIVADPLVSLHDADENKNTLQDQVVKVFRRICDETGAAFMVLAHTKKSEGHSDYHAGNAEQMRGASSVKDAMRMGFTLRPLSERNAEKMGIDWKQGRRLIRLDDAKKNFSEHCNSSEWYRLQSVRIPNGDHVGVPVIVDINELIGTEPEETEPKDQMTGCKFAEMIEQHAGDDILKRDKFALSDIKERISQRTGLTTRTMERYVTLISQDPKDPSRIRPNDEKYIEYYTEKSSGKTGKWYIYRKEIT